MMKIWRIGRKNNNKMGKLTTPDWVKEGFSSKEEWEKKKGTSKKKNSGKSYKIKICPKCKSSEVKVVLGGEEGKGSNGWGCLSCKWTGKSVDEKEMPEKEFLEHLEKMEGK